MIEHLETLPRVGTRHVSRIHPRRFETTSADLDLPAGAVPQELPTSLGNEEPLRYSGRNSSAVVYIQPGTGLKLFVGAI